MNTLEFSGNEPREFTCSLSFKITTTNPLNAASLMLASIKSSDAWGIDVVDTSTGKKYFVNYRDKTIEEIIENNIA